MAKTLIGNIRGKNGRGITSIKKTGTTGSVDTYTITYTDSTTSTFTVNNSDNIALQRQIVPSAAVESSATASQVYAAGDYVVVNGVLRKVKSAIAKGNAISDSNSTATTVTGELSTTGDSAPHVEVGDEDRIVFTPQTDCDVLVLCAASGIWGYAGGTVTMGVDCSQLIAVSKHVGKFSGGDTQSHQLVIWGVFSGAKAGVTYNFTISGSPQGDTERTALCMAVHL